MCIRIIHKLYKRYQFNVKDIRLFVYINCTPNRVIVIVLLSMYNALIRISNLDDNVCMYTY